MDKRIGPMLASFLEGLGFAAMARDCYTESNPERLRHYARIVLKQTRDDFAGKVRMKSHFAALGLV